MRIFKFLSIIVLVLGLSSCSVLINGSPCGEEYEPIPGYQNAGQKMVGIYYDADKTATAMDMFYENWTDDLGDYEAAERVLSNTCVEWEPYPWVLESLGTDEDGVPRRASGLTESRRDIRVWIGPESDEFDRAIWRTAFWHEIVHLMLWDLYNEPDPDHEEDAYVAWEPEHTQVIRDCKIEAQPLGV